MQKNNGAGGSFVNIVKSAYSEFYNSFYSSLLKHFIICFHSRANKKTASECQRF